MHNPNADLYVWAAGIVAAGWVVVALWWWRLTR